MSQVTYPLRIRMSGDKIAVLHKALLLAGIQVEATDIRKKYFGTATRKAVAKFQKRARLTVTGEVDEATAAQLTKLFKTNTYLVKGSITDPNGRPVKGALVKASDQDPRNEDPLGQTKTNTKGQYRINYTDKDFRKTDDETDGADIIIRVYAPDGKLIAESERYDNAPKKITIDVQIKDSSSPRVVKGKIYYDNRQPAANIELKIFRQDFGKEQAVATIKTDEKGNYEWGSESEDITSGFVIKIKDAKGVYFALNRPQFLSKDKPDLEINLVVPTDKVEADFGVEYKKLNSDIAPLLNGVSLADTLENDDRQDLSLLHQRTGWDARILALGAMAEKTAKDTGLASEVAYGLVRTGLPANPRQLANVSAETVKKALEITNEQGITKVNVDKAVKAFSEFSLAARIETPLPGGQHTSGEFLKSEKIRLTSRERTQFNSAYYDKGLRGEALWKELDDNTSISNNKIAKLQTQGKLSYLTLNNLTLTNELFGEVSDDMGKLVEMNYHKADTWKAKIGTLAEDDIDKFVPDAYQGEKPEDRLQNYADDMARKIRISYPTQVLNKNLDDNIIKLTSADGASLNKPVKQFLTNALAIDSRFVPGRKALGKFINDNKDELLAGTSASDEEEHLIEEVKTLQRLYQITPDDESLNIIHRLGIRSAQDVVRFEEEEFIRYYVANDKLTLAQALMIFKKARQVSDVTFNFFGEVKSANNTLQLSAVSPSTAEIEEITNNLIKQFPTLENLFGSLDYCECEHCKSVLSPAAYLVDLLQFLDRDESVWTNFIEDWNDNHSTDFDDQYKRPYEELKDRRPDISHLELTCENTNTVLPYIDAVNEILEFYVAKDKLNEDAAINTPEGTQTEDLIAEPQNVVPDAYEKLMEAKYPLNLPFDLWLEMVRAWANHFGTPLYKLMEMLRANDNFDITATQPYAYREIFLEYLGLSPSEYKIFTENNISKWFELYGYENQATALSSLSSAKMLSRKLDISYKTLTELIQTQFLNPKLANLPTLQKADIEIQHIYSYKNETGYPALSLSERTSLELKLTESGSSTEWLDERWDEGDFSEILVLFDTDTGCNFDTTIYRYADASPATRLDFLKLNLLVRLQKKLDWTIQETDEALMAFTPANVLPITESNIRNTFKTILLYFSHLKWLDEHLSLGKQGKQLLLSIWGNISTKGKNSLYEQYFLNPVTLREDPIFDDELGMYLQYLDSGVYQPFSWDKNNPEDAVTGNVGLENHINPIKAAFELTTQEIELILAEQGINLEDAALNIDTLSTLHRYSLLAKGLKMDVNELLSLTKLSGINPLTTLDNDLVSDISKDHPYTATIAFVQLAQKLNDSPFSILEYDYLIRHYYDINGNLHIDSNQIINLAKNIATEINRIEQQYSVPENIEGVTDEELFQMIESVFTPQFSDTFQAMWLGTKQWSVTKPDVAQADSIGNAFDAEDDLNVAYNDVREEETIMYAGVLTKARYDELKSTYIDAASSTLTNIQKAHLQEVIDEALQFFAENLGFIYASATDLDAEYQNVFDDSSTTRKNNLVPALLASVTEKQIRRFVTETLTGELETSEASTSFLLDYLSVEDALLNLVQNPVTLRHGTDSEGKKEAVISKSEIGTDTSASLSGYIEVPADGAYRFYVDCNAANIDIRLKFSHLPDDFLAETSDATNQSFSEFLDLKANTPYQFTLETNGLNDAETVVSLQVKGENLTKSDTANLSVFSNTAIEQLEQAYLLLNKSVMLIETMELSERELQYLTEHQSDFADFDFNTLPTNTTDGAQQIDTRFAQLLGLVDYVNLRQSLNSGSDNLITIFENASKNTPESTTALSSRLAELIRRQEADIQSITDFLTLNSDDFKNEKGLRKIWEIAELTHSFGVSVSALNEATTINEPSNDNAARYHISNNFKNAIKARYTTANWRKTAPSVFDPIRQMKRDALVAFIIDKDDFAREEQLFEYFLIDTGMEPVVKTSRIKLAISAVQLFIQRCLLNLEGPVIDSGGNLVKKGITPTSILSKHWQWMKRYRVWEANRKIFLYPENWLEPEFRDDKTHLYEELEGALLQGDVTQDLVERAFFNYLKQLEQISRLDMRAMYCEENLLDPMLNTLHVLGRTFNVPYQYYYRTYSAGEWTPWVPLGVEIESNHITMIKWRDRIHVFWLTFIEKAKSTASSGTIEDMADSTVDGASNKDVDVQLNWTEYYQGEWKAREAGGIGEDDVITLKDVGMIFNKANVYVHSTKEIVEGDEREVEIHITYGRKRGSFKLESKLSKPEEGTYNLNLATEIMYGAKKTESRHVRDLPLEVFTVPKTTVEDDGKTTHEFKNERILSKFKGRKYYLLVCTTPVDVYSGDDVISKIGANFWVSPFFFIDSRHTFFVQPQFREIITEIEEWIIDDFVFELPEFELYIPDRVRPIPEEFEVFIPVTDPIGPLVNPVRTFDFKDVDMFTQPNTIVVFDGMPITDTGRIDTLIQSDNMLTDIGNIGIQGLNFADGGNLSSLGTMLIEANSGSVISDVTLVGDGGFSPSIGRNLNINSSNVIIPR